MSTRRTFVGLSVVGKQSGCNVFTPDGPKFRYGATHAAIRSGVRNAPSATAVHVCVCSDDASRWWSGKASQDKCVRKHTRTFAEAGWFDYSIRKMSGFWNACRVRVYELEIMNMRNVDDKRRAPIIRIRQLSGAYYSTVDGRQHESKQMSMCVQQTKFVPTVYTVHVQEHAMTPSVRFAAGTCESSTCKPCFSYARL